MVAMVTDQVTREAGEAILLPQRRRQVIHVIEGILWITQAGDTTDMLLHAGESRSFTGYGRIAIQPFQCKATYVVEYERRGVGAMLHNLIHRLRSVPRLAHALHRLASISATPFPAPAEAVRCGQLKC